MEKPRDSENRQSEYLKYLNLGFEFLCAIGLPTGLGIWLDLRWKTLPLLTLLGLALGFATGFWLIYGQLYNGKNRRGGGRALPPRPPRGGGGARPGGGGGDEPRGRGG